MKRKADLDYYTCTVCFISKYKAAYGYETYRRKDGTRRLRATCKECEYKRTEKWRKENLEHRAGKIRELRAKNPLRDTVYHRKAKYGLTEQEFQKRLDNQSGVCAICKEVAPMLKNGRTGRNCNLGIGLLRDNLDVVKAAVEYLETYQ